MKKMLLALALTFAVLLLPARAVAVDSLPYLGSIRAEVLAQLTIASNNVVTTNKLEAAKQKKLIKSLLSARKTIDKTKTNYVAGAKALATLNKSLSRTVVSNEFNPLITGTVNIYVASFYDILDALEDRVDASYPGKANDSARKALAKFLAAVDGANTNSNFLLALKALSSAAKAEVGAQKAVVKAEHAPLPPATFKSTITGSILPTFVLTSTKDIPATAVYNIATEALQLNAVYERRVGKLLNTRIHSCLLTVTIPNIVDGTTIYQIGGGGGQAAVLALIGDNGIGGGSTLLYNGNAGTLTVTINKASRTAFGSFSFSAPANSGGTTASSSDGSFSMVWAE